MNSTLRNGLATPELNLAFFAFLLHFVWEMLQVPFFQAMASMPHWEGVLVCARAAFGDTFMAVVAFWLGGLPRRSRTWFHSPKRRELALYLGAGLLMTVIFEWLAIHVLDRWAYSSLMPRIPGIGIGLVPLLQWIVLPLLTLALVRRQLGGRPRANQSRPNT